MNLLQWAIKWSVPIEAVEDLRREYGLISTEPKPLIGESEGAVQTRIRLEASTKGLRIWRNNVGAYDEKNPPSPGSRWGLCNDSKEMNALIKSSDLIGVKPLLITQNHVGGIVGQFVAREVKAANWSYSGTKREEAQLNFLNLVAGMGGDAAFANSAGTL
tara:strand:+ start:954 stop:1433 length:480 start_codon:yes stop_codon:yes gene_type:complete